MENYKELLIKKERDTKQNLQRVLVVVPVIAVGIVSFLTLSLILLAITVALFVLAYFVFQWTDVEYEYLYLDKEITVDKIMSKTKRKKAGVINVNKIEIIAPQNSHQLDAYKNREVKLTDYSAGKDLPEQKLYVLYYEGNQKFLMNLDDEFIKIISNIIPRKVFTA